MEEKPLTILHRLGPFLDHLSVAAANQEHLHHRLHADVACHTAHEHQQAAQAPQRYPGHLAHLAQLEAADGGRQVCGGMRCVVFRCKVVGAGWTADTHTHMRTDPTVSSLLSLRPSHASPGPSQVHHLPGPSQVHHLPGPSQVHPCLHPPSSPPPHLPGTSSKSAGRASGTVEPATCV